MRMKLLKLVLLFIVSFPVHAEWDYRSLIEDIKFGVTNQQHELVCNSLIANSIKGHGRSATVTPYAPHYGQERLIFVLLASGDISLEEAEFLSLLPCINQSTLVDWAGFYKKLLNENPDVDALVEVLTDRLATSRES